jgi:hypothetical protein
MGFGHGLLVILLNYSPKLNNINLDIPPMTDNPDLIGCHDQHPSTDKGNELF